MIMIFNSDFRFILSSPSLSSTLPYLAKRSLMVDTWHSRGTPARKRRNKNWATSKTYLCYSGSERFWVWIKLFGTAKARESLQSFALICSGWILPLKSAQKLKDGSASVANHCKLAKNRCPTASPCRYTLHACRISKSWLQNAKKCHTFSILHWKNLGQILDQQFLLHLLRRGTSRCSRCICFRILSKVGWIFHPSKNGCNENGMPPTNPLASSAFSSAFLRFVPFFTSESWGLVGWDHNGMIESQGILSISKEGVVLTLLTLQN